MIPLIDEQLPEDRGTLTAKPVGLLKAAGMGIMKGAADVAGAGTILLGGLQGLNPEGQDKTFGFYEDVIKPARDYWAPDSASTSMA